MPKATGNSNKIGSNISVKFETESGLRTIKIKIESQSELNKKSSDRLAQIIALTRRAFLESRRESTADANNAELRARTDALESYMDKLNTAIHASRTKN